MGKDFFDTGVFFSALEGESEEAKMALEDAIIGDSAVTSALTVMEYSAWCYKSKDPKDAMIFNSFLKDNYFRVRVIDWKTAETAAAIKGENPELTDTDAMQLAAAIESDCSRFFTVDKKLLKVKDSRLEIKVLA